MVPDVSRRAGGALQHAVQGRPFPGRDPVAHGPFAVFHEAVAQERQLLRRVLERNDLRE
jgi:hypothetical protein